LVLMDPNDINSLQKLGDIEDRTGYFSKALAYYSEALRKSNQAQDSIAVYKKIENHYERLGQFGESLKTATKREKLLSTLSVPSLVRLQLLLSNDRKLFEVGKEDEYKKRMEELKQILPQRASLIDCFGGFITDVCTENIEGLENMTEECYVIMKSVLGTNFDITMDVKISRLNARLNGDFVKAIEAYEAYIEATGAGVKIFGQELCELYRKGDQLQKARDFMEKLLLEDPSQPVLLIEKAKIALAMGDSKGAKIFYSKAMDIWKDADENYKIYADAKAFGLEMEGMD